MLKQVLSKRGLTVAGFAIGFGLFSANLALGAYFMDRVYPGVKVTNLGLGGLTRDEARAVLTNSAVASGISLTLDDQHYNLTLEDFGAEYQIHDTLNAAFAVGRDNVPELWGFFKALNSQPLNFAYLIDNAKLRNYVKKVSSTQALAPVDAAIVVVNGEPTIQPDRSGLGINSTELTSALTASLNGSRAVTVKRSFIKADIQADEITSSVNAAKAIIATPVTLKYQDKVFIPSRTEIGSWLRFEKSDHNLKASLDSTKIKAYLATVAKTINVPPVNKKINVVNGEIKSEEGGVDGSAIDSETLAKSIYDQLAVHRPTTLDITTHPVAYKVEYNRTVNLDSAARYIEINLSLQRLWAYQDHNVVYQSPVTSGATGAGFPTVQGLFSVYGKERNRNLNGYAIGYNYNVFVQYWMPFSGNYGMHDASWRSSFGGQDYYYGGSHGCVNMPLETAAWLFNWADIGTPVWVHA